MVDMEKVQSIEVGDNTLSITLDDDTKVKYKVNKKLQRELHDQLTQVLYAP